jgi:hypothetical protein
LTGEGPIERIPCNIYRFDAMPIPAIRREFFIDSLFESAEDSNPQGREPDGGSVQRETEVSAPAGGDAGRGICQKHLPDV